jgi:hypothetical protein
MQVGVAGELAVEDPQHREVEAVEERIRSSKEIRDRMRAGHFLEVVTVRDGLPHHRRRRPSVSGEVAHHVRLAASRDRSRRERRRVLLGVEPQR